MYLLLDASSGSLIPQVALDTLSIILRRSGRSLEFVKFYIDECGGKDRIELLINHENSEVFDLAQEISDRYFAKDYYVLEDVNDPDSFIINVT